MVDIGHKQTDEVLERLEKRLAKEYAQAYKDVEKKASDYFARFEEKDKWKKTLVDAGKLSKKDYQTWRRNQMLTGERWTDLRDQLAKDLTNTNQIAAGIVRGELNEVFAINANYSEYLIENGMRTNYGFTLYDRDTIANLVKNDPDIIPWKPEVDISADLRWNRQMITSHITQGILQGESIPNLSKRLAKTVNNDKVAAVRTARTAVTSSQNAGRQMVYDRAKKMGLKLQKEWLATLDGRTRHEHGAVDGQRVPLDGEFTVGGYKMKYPGDMSAPAYLVYNCRCTTITVDPDYITKGDEPRLIYSEWIKGKDVEDIKKEMSKQIDSLSYEEKYKINRYTGFNATRFNMMLGKGKIDKKYEEDIEILNKALMKGIIPKQVNLFRDTTKSNLGFEIPDNGNIKELIGTKIKNKIFTSTSFNNLGLAGRNAHIRYIAPEGYKGAMYVKKLASPSFRNQEEVVFARGMEWEVSDIWEAENNVFVVANILKRKIE